ncbi:MAG: type IV secretory system conjugative DNA transfer family protein [Bacteroidales bacterium]|jgi:hypothetical protein|nr:type IV secretory system conjugative DNA transfer family protein [Bacteroidales bacterium]
MESEKKHYVSGVIVIVLTVLFFFVLIGWMKDCNLHFLPTHSLVDKIASKGITMRFLFVASYAGFILVAPANVRIKDEKTKYILFVNTLLLALIFILGCISIDVYDLIIYPGIFILYLFVSVYAISAFKRKSFKTESIFGITNEKSDFYFTFGTDQGDLTIHKPQQGVYIESGTGGGKSDTFIKSIIEQCCIRNYAMCVYDWEGDPDKDKSPLLTRVAYGCLQKQHGCELKFAFVNFIDMTRTVRVNVFSEKYMPKGNETLFIRNIIITLMKNLEPAWKNKTDFWANNAMTYVYSVAYKCYKERHKGINTLSHVIAICLGEIDAVFEWLSQDEEISLTMSSMLSAYRLNAQQQTAGAVSSAQTPLSMLNNRNIFWVFSPKADEEFDLDITNKKNPALFCIGNAPAIREAVSPAISCILSVILFNMNNPGKSKSVLLIDEFPTIVLQGLENFIATVRKHFVATILALQDFAQAKNNLGEDPAKILRSNCATQAYGQTNNYETAKMVQDLLGDIDQVSESFTTQDLGGGSKSESLKKEKVIIARDIAGQPTGHFVGKVANGKPPFFSAQFDYAPAVEQEIPQFSCIIDTKDVVTNRELMDAMVYKNYEKILQEVKELLKPFSTPNQDKITKR